MLWEQGVASSNLATPTIGNRLIIKYITRLSTYFLFFHLLKIGQKHTLFCLFLSYYVYLCIENTSVFITQALPTNKPTRTITPNTQD